MARQRDLLNRLTDAGEDAIQRLGEAPGMERVFGVATNLRDRVDELQRRMRGLDALERRVRELERRVDELSAARSTSRSKSGASSSRKKSTTSGSRKKTSSSSRSSSGSS